MDKDKIKAQLGEAAVKTKAAMSEIKANFKADEGTTGFRKIQSMFINLWKSGTTGRVALVASGVVCVLLLFSFFGGGGSKSANGAGTEGGFDGGATASAASKKAVPKDMLVVKGVHMRQSGDDAAEACKNLFAESKTMVAIDFRNGIEREKDEATKAADKKAYEDKVKLAEADVEKFLKWNSRRGESYDPSAKECISGARDDCHPSIKVAVKDAKIPGNDGSFATHMAALAGIYGYQVEWMLPAKRKNQTGGAKKPKLHTMGTLEIPKERSIGDYWFHDVMEESDKLKKEIYLKNVNKLYEQGFQVSNGHRERVFFRLTLRDATGNPVEKNKLAEELVFGQQNDFAKFKTKQEKLAFAEKEVGYFLKWVEIGYDVSRILVAKPFDPSDAGTGSTRGRSRGEMMRETQRTRGGRVAADKMDEPVAKGGMFMDKGGRCYHLVMSQLAHNCKVVVEWAVLAETAEAYEEIKETVAIPGGTAETAWKFVGELENNLGRYADAYNSQRKRLLYEKDLEDVLSPLWFRLVLKTTNGVEVSESDVAKNWLAARGYYPPSDKVILSKQNLIRIAVKKEGINEDKLEPLCNVWIDKEGNVKEMYFNDKGMAMIFNAADLSTEEFAKALVKNYPGIPHMEQQVKKVSPWKAAHQGNGFIQETTLTYKSPKGYQVKLFERAFVNALGTKFNSYEKLSNNNMEIAYYLSMANLSPTRFLSITAIKPESERKFD